MLTIKRILFIFMVFNFYSRASARRYSGATGDSPSFLRLIEEYIISLCPPLPPPNSDQEPQTMVHQHRGV